MEKTENKKVAKIDYLCLGDCFCLGRLHKEGTTYAFDADVKLSEHFKVLGPHTDEVSPEAQIAILRGEIKDLQHMIVKLTAEKANLESKQDS